MFIFTSHFKLFQKLGLKTKIKLFLGTDCSTTLGSKYFIVAILTIVRSLFTLLIRYKKGQDVAFVTTCSLHNVLNTSLHSESGPPLLDFEVMHVVSFPHSFCTFYHFRCAFNWIWRTKGHLMYFMHSATVLSLHLLLDLYH